MARICCDSCEENFDKKPSQIARSEKHYCSRSCAAEGRKNGKHVECFWCGGETYKAKKYLEKNKRQFCSKACSLKWNNSTLVGEKHPNWKSGKSSYKKRLETLDLEVKCFLCDEEDKRVLIVHHADEDRENNKFTNLYWLCYNCHHLVHRYKSEKERFLTQIA